MVISSLQFSFLIRDIGMAKELIINDENAAFA